jgi:thymidylate synthase ThyX
MGYSAKILLDSISETGKRLTTFEVTFPRIVLAEFNTHRMFSRNSASSRAIPFSKQLKRVMEDPFIPERFPINGKGMQPGGYYEPTSIDHQKATEVWLKARDQVIEQAKKLVGEDYAWLEDSKHDFVGGGYPRYLHVHKQIANRLLEPFQWHTVIVTATEFDNFFKLRTHTDAQAEIKTIADLMYKHYHFKDSGYAEYQPKLLKSGEWHLPLVSNEDISHVSHYLGYGDKYLTWNHYTDALGKIAEEFLEILKQISVARCARVSYLTHDGIRDIVKDLELFERLKTSGHFSPFEHVAQPSFYIVGDPENAARDYSRGYSRSLDNKYFDLRNGNFVGWRQMRQDLLNENCEHFRK